MGFASIVDKNVGNGFSKGFINQKDDDVVPNCTKKLTSVGEPTMAENDPSGPSEVGDFSLDQDDLKESEVDVEDLDDKSDEDYENSSFTEDEERFSDNSNMVEPTPKKKRKFENSEEVGSENPEMPSAKEKTQILHYCTVPGCTYASQRTGNVNRHFKSIHQIKSNKKQVKCCGVIYYNAFDYKKHKTLVHKDGNYYCEICNKEFKKLALLNRHKSVHSKFRDIVCTECGYKTDLAYNMGRHCISKIHSCNHVKVIAFLKSKFKRIEILMKEETKEIEIHKNEKLFLILKDLLSASNSTGEASEQSQDYNETNKENKQSPNKPSSLIFKVTNEQPKKPIPKKEQSQKINKNKLPLENRGKETKSALQEVNKSFPMTRLRKSQMQNQLKITPQKLVFKPNIENIVCEKLIKNCFLFRNGLKNILNTSKSKAITESEEVQFENPTIEETLVIPEEASDSQPSIPVLESDSQPPIPVLEPDPNPQSPFPVIENVPDPQLSLPVTQPALPNVEFIRLHLQRQFLSELERLRVEIELTEMQHLLLNQLFTENDDILVNQLVLEEKRLRFQIQFSENMKLHLQHQFREQISQIPLSALQYNDFQNLFAKLDYGCQVQRNYLLQFLHYFNLVYRNN